MIAHDVVLGELERMGAAGDMSRYGEAAARLHDDRSLRTGARSPARQVSDQEWKQHEDTEWYRLNYRRNIAKDQA